MVATSIFQIQSIDLIDICLNVGGEYNTDTIATLNGKNKTSGLQWNTVPKKKGYILFIAVSFKSEWP